MTAIRYQLAAAVFASLAAADIWMGLSAGALVVAAAVMPAFAAGWSLAKASWS